MKDKNRVIADMFYVTFMTGSLFFMWKSVLLLNERVTKLEHKYEEQQKFIDVNIEQINKNFKAQKEINNKFKKILNK